MKLVLVALLAFTSTAVAQGERYLVFRKGEGAWINAEGKNARPVATRPVPGALLAPNALAWAGVTEGRLWVKGADGRFKREIVKGVTGDFRWTMDSTGLVFVAGNDIHAVDVSTKTVRRLTKSREPLRRPALDASGNWLVYLHGRDLVLKHLVAHEERVLVRDATSAVYAWSPKAGQFAWADGAGLHLWDVYTEEHVRRKNPVPLADVHELSWTPMGNAVGLRKGRTLHLVYKKAKAKAIVLPAGSDPAPVRWQLLMFDG